MKEKRRRPKNTAHNMAGNIGQFGEHVRATDMIGIELDHKRIQFDCGNYKLERKSEF